MVPIDSVGSGPQNGPVNLNGILPPCATPFHDDEIDLDGLRSNLRRAMRTGLRGVVILGSNGEAPFIDLDELERVVAAAREEVPSDRALIVGTGRQSTRQTKAACERAALAGADAVLVLTPSVFKAELTPDVLLRHYRTVADASRVPVLLYNHPGATGVNLTPALARALSEHANVIGIKESSGDVGVVSELVTQLPPSFPVVVGSAPTLYPSLVCGATGGVVAVANVVPELCVRLHALVRDGRHEEALALQRAITPLARAVTTTYGVPGLKLAMELAGYVGGAPRLPLVPVGDAARNAITELYERCLLVTSDELRVTS
jgi:4-hydroxy-2-oxoglutarate aldolase